jgi:tetratricopeptide (TPR) repeat protein
MTRGVPAEALAGACDPAELREVHARTAAWLLGRVDNLAPLHGTLAHHWRAAGDHENALRFLELAGNEAQRIGAMVEAGQWFQQALRLVETTPGLAVDPIRRAYWERSLGDVRYACGELERCRVHFDRALALLGRPLPQGRVALLRFVAGQILRWCLLGPLGGDREAAPAAESARHQEASHASERLAERYYYSADVLSMTAASLTSAILARRAGARGRNARPFASIGVIAGILGLDAYAARLHRHALAIGERAGDGAGLTVVLYTRAAHLAGRGEWDAAQDLACRAVAEAERAAAWQEGGVAQTLLGLVFRYQGRFAEAEGCFLALLERARNQYNAQHEAWALYGLGQIQTQTGRFQEAVRSLNLAFSLLRNLEDYPSRLIAQGLLASVLWRQGRRDRALEAAELAWALATQVRRPFVLSTLDGYSGAAEVFLRVWEGERAGGRNLGPAERRARDAVRLVGQFARTFPFGRPSWWQLRGREAAIAGHMDRAVAAWRRCIEEGVRLRTRLAVAESQAALARSGLLAEDEQRRLLDRSNEAFSAMGCLWHLERNRPAVHGRLAGTQQGQPQ